MPLDARPGALNLTTGAAYALLGAMPMVMITGQKGILSRKQARFQIVDIVATMTPLTKLARQIVSPATIPTIVRESFRVAQQERPGPVLLELPEDIAAEIVAGSPALVPPHPIDPPIAPMDALDRAAGLIREAERPLVMLGAAASRPRLAEALSDFVRRLQIPFFNTQMGKGSVSGGSGLYLGTAALSERDHVHRAIDRADLIVAIGHDTVEKPPFLMGPKGPTVLHVGYLPATVEEGHRQLNGLRQVRLPWAVGSESSRGTCDVRPGHEGPGSRCSMISSVGVGRTAEEVCYLIVSREKALGLPGRFEALHDALPSSRRLMAVFRSIV